VRVDEKMARIDKVCQVCEAVQLFDRANNREPSKYIAGCPDHGTWCICALSKVATPYVDGGGFCDSTALCVHNLSAIRS
jgi:hypothetical protein